ncbi:MAG: hypothetical protein K0V04_07170 [Deltaproteobacteria bacterium]|nr:hypothetical protein [Deltaproteobacteria bacterium]
MSSSVDPSRWLDDLAAAAGVSPGASTLVSLDAQVDEIVRGSRRLRRRRRAAVVGGALAAVAAVAVVWTWRPGQLVADGTGPAHFQAPSSRDATPRVHSTATPAPAERRSVADAGEATPLATEPLAQVPAEHEAEPSVAAEPQPRPPASPRTAKPRRLVTAAGLLERAQQARARRDAADARAALTQLRRRFPEHPAAEQATFLLGRVEHELARRPDQAQRWFRAYVDRYPHGRFVSQARGRIVRHHATDPSSQLARRAAADYLAHHEAGPFAETARGILAEPSR